MKAINEKAKLPHRYLKGKHKGIFNRKASKIYDEIILTESIIDALSLIQIGIENTQSIYGTNGFTEEHLQILSSHVIILQLVSLQRPIVLVQMKIPHLITLLSPVICLTVYMFSGTSQLLT